MQPLDQYNAYVNIGGGASSIGFGAAKDSMNVGVVFPIEVDDIVEENNGFSGSIAYNFLQNDVLTGSNSGASGTISTMTEVSAVSLGISGTNIGTVGSNIHALNIYNTLKTEMLLYTNVKNTNAIVNMTGAGQQYSDTQIAHLPTGQRTNPTISQPGTLTQGQVVSSTSIESFMSSLANTYNTERGTTYTLTKTICHSSCHSSCHGSRSRR